MSKSLIQGLLTSPSTTYNKLATYLGGAASVQTVNSQSVVCPPLNVFVDVFTQAGIVPAIPLLNSTTGRCFCLSAASATPTVYLATWNPVTNAVSFTGFITLRLANLAATTYIERGWDVNDSGATWQIYIAETGSVVINGGIHQAYGLTAADFQPGGTTIWPALSNGIKGIYLMHPADAFGAGNNLTTIWGVRHLYSSASSTWNQKIICFNNTVAAPQCLLFDSSITPQIIPVGTASTVASTSYAGTSPAAFFTTGATNPGIVAGDPICFVNTAPTNFTASVQGAAQTTYFVRDVQLVTGNWYFNLANTTAGAALTPTSTGSSWSIIRSFGTSINQFSGRTPTTGLSPSFTGVLVQANTIDYANPVSTPANVALQGVDCVSLATQTSLIMGKLADLFTFTTGTTTGSTMTVASATGLAPGYYVWGPGIAAGTTISTVVGTTVSLSTPVTSAQAVSVAFTFGSNNWSSCTQVNATGTGNDVVAPTVAFCRYSKEMDSFVYVTNTSSLVMKKLMNGGTLQVFGSVSNTFFENPSNPLNPPMGFAALGGIHVNAGYVCIAGNTPGQRGLMISHIYSDDSFGFTYAILPIAQVPIGTFLRYLLSLRQSVALSTGLNYYVRTAATTTDTTFSTPTSGTWMQISSAQDLTAIVSLNQVFQIKIGWNTIIGLGVPAVPQEIVAVLTYLGEASIKWCPVVDYSSQAGTSPEFVSWVLQNTYNAGVVPTTLVARAYDQNNALRITQAINGNAAVTLSTNSGTSFGPNGTIPNVANTTVIKLTVSSPPSDATFLMWTLSES